MVSNNSSHPSSHNAVYFSVLDCPWPSYLTEYTGLSIMDLQECCMAIYEHCLTDKHTVTDNRSIKLEAVVHRYSLCGILVYWAYPMHSVEE